jgi:hypothetical protein
MGSMPTRLVVLLATCAWMVLLALPATASATTGGYASHPWPGCTGGFNSGSWDDSGIVYVPCGAPSTIGAYDADGRLIRSIPAGRFVSDVAPTRDGRFLYLAGDGPPSRLARQSDGSYAPDPTWRPERYPIWGTSYAPGGYFIATDAAGNVYLADGTWGANLTHTVVKYDPTGRFVTRFGEWANSWQLGTFYWALGGLAVSADGATVYTVELGNNRVQRWRRQPAGSYAAADALGSTAATNPDRAGYCDYAGWRGTLAAPYDVALDAADNLYVINTTCKQVLSFAPGFGAMRANLDVRVAGGDYPRPHGFAVGRDGAVYVGENQRVLRPGGAPQPADGGPPLAAAQTDPAPTPRPDRIDSSGDDGSAAIEVTPRPARPPQQSATSPTRTLTGVAVGAARLRGTRRPQVHVPVRCAARCRVELQVRRGGRVIARRVAWLAPAQRRWLTTSASASAARSAVAVTILVRDPSGARATYRRLARPR